MGALGVGVGGVALGLVAAFALHRRRKSPTQWAGRVQLRWRRGAGEAASEGMSVPRALSARPSCKGSASNQ